MELKPYEKKIISELLEAASDIFARHSANQYDLPDFMTHKERHQLMKNIEYWNNSPEEYDEEWSPEDTITDGTDWVLMGYLADRVLHGTEKRAYSIECENREEAEETYKGIQQWFDSFGFPAAVTLLGETIDVECDIPAYLDTHFREEWME